MSDGHYDGDPNGPKNRVSELPKFFIDPKHAGIVRGGFFDGPGGIIVGVNAQWVCDALNEKMERS